MSRRRTTYIDKKWLASQIRDAIEHEIEHSFFPGVVVPEVEALVRKLFEKTIAQWEGGAGALRVDGTITSRIEPDPPSLQVQTIRMRDKHIRMNVHVKSYIWNLLDQGRVERVTTKPEKFVARKKPRTIPGTLDVSGDRTYTEVVHVPAGTVIEGFEARGWTQLIIDGVKKELNGKYPFIKFTFTIEE
jgi:hypothetical protein